MRQQRPTHDAGPGKWRWIVERTVARLHNHRRQRIRREPDAIFDTAARDPAMAHLQDHGWASPTVSSE